MEILTITAEARDDLGKGASRRLRHSGKTPGIVYGGSKTPTPIMLDHNDLMHHLEHEAFYSHILTLEMGKKKEQVVLRDLQRHPHKPMILHFDLQRISATEKLTMRVPLHFINEASCAGVKKGGVVSHVINELEVHCLPKDLPEYIEVDMAAIDLGGGVHLADLVVPPGVEIAALTHGGDAAQVVATVHMAKKVVEEEVESAEADAEQEDDAEGGAS